ncbi:hypothetical protein MtrunA17_Chr4g0063101 [Medicago truncatula]|uniref:Uncharacterized protein n=1 Tax=Medicago truncatula TaxID=3880 RepID=G7JU87_MEDTR|nr:hypothetical protein MTR_4g113430 [Medicago truncatula]RHN63883.1 hypothetical protein MtrunA17_Chr4g0063101 [Medicago truncatula]
MGLCKLKGKIDLLLGMRLVLATLRIRPSSQISPFFFYMLSHCFVFRNSSFWVMNWFWLRYCYSVSNRDSMGLRNSLKQFDSGGS